MSRYYGMSVRVIGANPTQIDAIQQAAEDQWPFEDWLRDGEGVLTASAEDRLCGGETEEEFARRLAGAVWRANGEFCQVEVTATYLEDLPCETYCFGQDDYEKLTTSEPSTLEEPNDG